MSSHTLSMLACILVVAGCGREADNVGPEVATPHNSTRQTGTQGPNSDRFGEPAAVAAELHNSQPAPTASYHGRPMSDWLVELESGNPTDRLRAVEALGQIGPSVSQVVPALVKRLDDADGRVRGAAVDQLGRFGPASGDAVGALIVTLSDGEIEVRWKSAEALGAIGPAAKAAVPALVGALQDEVPNVRNRAGEALLKINPDAGHRAGVQ
jgi:HEAT repeats/PBS lyase HEAT-like repeat